jgi:hypothetical protein
MFKKIFGKIFNSEDKAAREEEYFKRTSNKRYKKEETPQFSDDYFKSTDSPEEQNRDWHKKANENEQQQARQQTQQQEQARQAKPESEEESQSTARKTEMSDGTTIIDDRDTSSVNRKIFAPTEGEYTDFEVVGQ